MWSQAAFLQIFVVQEVGTVVIVKCKILCHVLILSYRSNLSLILKLSS